MKQGNEYIPAYVIHVCRKKLLNPKIIIRQSKKKIVTHSKNNDK